MTAKSEVKKMAQALLDAGYTVHSYEITNTKITFSIVTPDSQGWYVLNEMFYISASLNPITNRWSSYFSYSTHGLFVQTERKKMTRLGMWRQITSSVKFEASQFQKVGA